MTSVRYRLQHRTEYRYTAPVSLARHLLHLRPRATAWQDIESFCLDILPESLLLETTDGTDSFGNPVTCLELQSAHSELIVDSDIIWAVAPRPWAQAALADSQSWDTVRDALRYAATPLSDALYKASQFLFESPHVRVKRELVEFAAPSFPPGRSLLQACRDLMERIHDEFEYAPAATEVGTSIVDVLTEKRGVCQDFAHLMIGALRSLGLPARYVSGYLRTDPPEGQPRLVGVDASHAWAAVFAPGAGWVEFDPTNGCLADERYLLLAWGRDFGDVSPVRGVIHGGGEHTLKVGVTVTPLEEKNVGGSGAAERIGSSSSATVAATGRPGS